MTADHAPHEAALKLFGDTVHLERSRLRLTQEDLAARSGLSRVYIGTIERGDSNPTLVTILRLAAALQIEPALLMQPYSLRPDLYHT